MQKIEKLQHLPPELQKLVDSFESDKSSYLTLQEQLATFVQESERLERKAAELEGQATRTDASLTSLATTATVDSEKITQEISRSTQLRNEAQSLRQAVKARSAIERNLIVRVAEARMVLLGRPAKINSDHWADELNELYAHKEVRDSIMKILTLSRALFLNKLKEHDGPLRHCNTSQQREIRTEQLFWEDLGNSLKKLLGDELSNASATLLVEIPPAIRKEAMVRSPADMHRLRQAGVGH